MVRSERGISIQQLDKLIYKGVKKFIGGAALIFFDRGVQTSLFMKVIDKHCDHELYGGPGTCHPGNVKNLRSQKILLFPA
jgi:hypothetical protein